MELLENRIREDAEVLPGNILKVSNFLNHQIDVKLMDQMGEEFARLYKDTPVTKILTIESSGIAVAYSVAQKFGVPLVFAKKHKSSNVNEDVYSAKVWSFTHNQEYTVVVSKKYISPGDKILLVDDFLANGAALNGLIKIAEDAGAKVQGICIAIEKGFQNGGKELREKGYRVESLAIVDKMTDDGKIQFRS
ncbi:xanthine phosphoribosyltransferase [uncultured Treponema sp.]|uniref:xanthine phosphoribosyltransferase n=1 Tax=uncultured Treponema sp. TaxID=162155 RepID=UPI0015AD534A|nr:xanthine phosphoribosyltransferase [uncultured Treponema sp.]